MSNISKYSGNVIRSDRSIGLIAESSSNKIFGQRTFEFNMSYPGRASSIFKFTKTCYEKFEILSQMVPLWSCGPTFCGPVALPSQFSKI